MAQTADVVVLGAGVMGASVAFHLTRLGASVLILERGTRPAEGSTARATGGFRAQYASDINVRLSLLSLRQLEQFSDDTGGDAGYVPVGYLFLAANEGQMTLLREAVSIQRMAGLDDTRFLTPDEALRASPGISVEGVVGATFGPRDGYIRPDAIAAGYLGAALRAGARLSCSAAPATLRQTAGGDWDVVLESGGQVSAGHVVNAAGAWAAEVARLAGTDIPVTPVRRQVAVTVATGALPPTTPMTIFALDNFHFRVRAGRILLLWPTETAGSDPYDVRFDARWLAGVEARMQARIPALDGVGIDREQCWCGLYEMSPDHHALLGRAPGLERFWCINGSSGHGVMHSPALGLLLAEQIVLGESRTLDTSALDPDRFRRGRPNPAPVLL